MKNIKELIDNERKIHKQRQFHCDERRRLSNCGKSNTKEYKFYDSEISRLASVEKKAKEELNKERGFYSDSNKKLDGDCYGNKYSVIKKSKTLSFDLHYELSEGDLSCCLMWLKNAVPNVSRGGYGGVFFRDIFLPQLTNVLDNPKLLKYIDAKTEDERQWKIEDRAVLEKISYLDNQIKKIKKKRRNSKNPYDEKTKLAKEEWLLKRMRLDLKLYFNIKDEEMEDLE